MKVWKLKAMLLLGLFLIAVTANSGAKLNNMKHEFTKECAFETEGLCLPIDYSRMNRPSVPVSVNANIRIGQISEVNDNSDTVDFLAWVTLFWNDNRLIMKDKTVWRELEDFWFEHEFSHEWHDRLWLPDLYIVGLKDMKINRFPHQNYCKLQSYTSSFSFSS